MGDAFKKWFKEKAKEADLHHRSGVIKGYRLALADARSVLLGKTLTVGEAEASLRRLMNQIEFLEHEAERERRKTDER